MGDEDPDAETEEERVDVRDPVAVRVAEFVVECVLEVERVWVEETDPVEELVPLAELDCLGVTVGTAETELLRDPEAVAVDDLLVVPDRVCVPEAVCVAVDGALLEDVRVAERV